MDPFLTYVFCCMFLFSTPLQFQIKHNIIQYIYKSIKKTYVGQKDKDGYYGRFHVKGPRKKVNVEKWILLMKCESNLMILAVFFNNFSNFKVFLAQKDKYKKKLLF